MVSSSHIWLFFAVEIDPVDDAVAVDGECVPESLEVLPEYLLLVVIEHALNGSEVKDEVVGRADPPMEMKIFLTLLFCLSMREPDSASP